MLIDDRCSIYEHRPKTCRVYDCRVFPATGLEPDEQKVALTRQVQRWRFSFPTAADRVQLDAVRAAATFLRDRQDVLPDDAVPTNATQLAVLAVDMHDVFLHRGETTDEIAVVDPDPRAVRVELTRRRRARDAT